MRIANRFLALLLGVALASAAVIAVVEIVLGLTDNASAVIPRQRWDRELSTLEWDQDWLVITLAAMGVAGLLLLAAQLVPRRPDTVAAESDRDGVEVVYGRRGLEQELGEVVREHPSVLNARVRRKRNRVHVRADVPATAADSDIGATGSGIQTDVRSAAERLGLQRKPKVRVRLDQARRRVQ